MSKSLELDIKTTLDKYIGRLSTASVLSSLSADLIDMVDAYLPDIKVGVIFSVPIARRTILNVIITDKLSAGA